MAGKDESDLNQAFLLILTYTLNDFSVLMKSLLSDVADVQYKLKNIIDWKAAIFTSLGGKDCFIFPFPKFKYNEENCRIDRVMTIYFITRYNHCIN